MTQFKILSVSRSMSIVNWGLVSLFVGWVLIALGAWVVLFVELIRAVLYLTPGVSAETIHAMVVAAFKRDALTPARVEQAVREELEARAQYPAELTAERHKLRQSLGKLEAELERRPVRSRVAGK